MLTQSLIITFPALCVVAIFLAASYTPNPKARLMILVIGTALLIAAVIKLDSYMQTNPETGFPAPISIAGVTTTNIETPTETLTPAEAIEGQSNAIKAYKRAAINAPCPIKASLIAGIGYVETQHGTYAGTTLNTEGVTSKPILGLPLDGTNGTMRIEDTDNGQLDNDTTFDRAVGPMQFIPASWEMYGADGDGDGIKNPSDIDDAAAATANHLCLKKVVKNSIIKEELNLVSNTTHRVHAIAGYNATKEYRMKVLAAESNYRKLGL